MDDAAGLTRKVVKAAAAAGSRLLLAKGWGGLGEGLEELGAAPDQVMLLDAPCPHDWLFTQCAAVVHHGGAGTTAAGLKAGAPRRGVLCGVRSRVGSAAQGRLACR